MSKDVKIIMDTLTSLYPHFISWSLSALQSHLDVKFHHRVIMYVGLSAGTCINMICVHSIAFVLVSMLYVCNDTSRNVLGTFHYITVAIMVKSVKMAAFKAL